MLKISEVKPYHNVSWMKAHAHLPVRQAWAKSKSMGFPITLERFKRFAHDMGVYFADERKPAKARDWYNLEAIRMYYEVHGWSINEIVDAIQKSDSFHDECSYHHIQTLVEKYEWKQAERQEEGIHTNPVWLEEQIRYRVSLKEMARQASVNTTQLMRQIKKYNLDQLIEQLRQHDKENE